MVICYSYLWHGEYVRGREEGVKDRPCAVVAAIRKEEAGDWKVLVLPITHTPPARAEEAIEIPQETKCRLGLDSDRSWIMLTEWNEFYWSGSPDLRFIVGENERKVNYGYLPTNLFAKVREEFLSTVRRGAARAVIRTA